MGFYDNTLYSIPPVSMSLFVLFAGLSFQVTKRDSSLACRATILPLAL